METDMPWFSRIISPSGLNFSGQRQVSNYCGHMFSKAYMKVAAEFLSDVLRTWPQYLDSSDYQLQEESTIRQIS